MRVRFCVLVASITGFEDWALFVTMLKDCVEVDNLWPGLLNDMSRIFCGGPVIKTRIRFDWQEFRSKSDLRPFIKLERDFNSRVGKAWRAMWSWRGLWGSCSLSEQLDFTFFGAHYGCQFPRTTALSFNTSSCFLQFHGHLQAHRIPYQASRLPSKTCKQCFSNGASKKIESRVQCFYVEGLLVSNLA